MGWADMESGLRARVESRLGALDSLPLLTVRLTSTLMDPEIDPREVASMASTDPAVVAEILRIVNSAFFGLRQPVGSLHRAILLLGYTRVRFIVLRLGLERSVPSGTAPAASLAAVWRHSFLACGALPSLGGVLSGISPSEIETATLLHDLGKLLLVDMSMRDNLADELELDSDSVTMEKRIILEDDCFGTNHCVLGDKISERLNLPDFVRIAQLYHHHPLDRLPESAARGLGLKVIAAVKLCSTLARDFLHRRAALTGGEPDSPFAAPDMDAYSRAFPNLPAYRELQVAADPGLAKAYAFLESVD